MRASYLSVAVMVAVVWAPTGWSADLRSLQMVFDKEVAQSDERLKQAVARADERYANNLRVIISNMQKLADEFGVRPAQDELKRFEQEGRVPGQSEPGTPELVEKARGFHREAVRKAEGERTDAVKRLATLYNQRLLAVRAEYASQNRQADVDAVAAELRRIAPMAAGEAGTGMGAGAPAPAPVDKNAPALLLPAEYKPGLVAAYVFDAPQSDVVDHSGRRNVAVVRQVQWEGGKNPKGSLNFNDELDKVELKSPLALRNWTFVATVEFPLDGDGVVRVLMSAGFKQHHVAVDEVGELGVYAGRFAGSGFNVAKLKGWHKLAAVATGGKTSFYIDGEPVGVAASACVDPVVVIGNDTLGRNPWEGRVADVLIWAHPQTARGVKALSQAVRP